MKNVVLNDIGREVEFKPQAIFTEYLKLTEADIRKEFADRRSLIRAACPACGTRKGRKVFVKFGFPYRECVKCGTVYVSRRPSDADIEKHYKNSISARFWRNALSRATEDKRREKIYGPRLQWLIDVAQEYCPDVKTIADVHTKDNRYIHELAGSDYFKNKVIIAPYSDIMATYFDKNSGKNVKIVPGFIKDGYNCASCDIVCGYEILDLASDVDMLINAIKNILVKEGLFILTTISISGFDTQILWGESQSIFPPDRINVFSRKGLEILFKRHDFEILEYSTPGLLDFDIVKNAYEKGSKQPIPRFVRTMIESGNKQLFYDFQEFLQINKLSSFVRVTLRNK